MFRPEGIYPALLTPFDENQKVNEPELRKLLDFGIDRGLDGIFPISSVGEGIHMDFDEKCRCMDIVVDQVDGRVPVTPGVVASAPAECVRLAKHAESIGCEAIVVTPPYFYKPGGAMVERFFETIIEESRVERSEVLRRSAEIETAVEQLGLRLKDLAKTARLHASGNRRSKSWRVHRGPGQIQVNHRPHRSEAPCFGLVSWKPALSKGVRGAPAKRAQPLGTRLERGRKASKERLAGATGHGLTASRTCPSRLT